MRARLVDWRQFSQVRFSAHTRRIRLASCIREERRTQHTINKHGLWYDHNKCNSRFRALYLYMESFGNILKVCLFSTRWESLCACWSVSTWWSFPTSIFWTSRLVVCWQPMLRSFCISCTWALNFWIFVALKPDYGTLIIAPHSSGSE